MKPILKWAGGKTRVAPEISKAFGEKCSGYYYELFAGSAAVFLHRLAEGEVQQKKAFLWDINYRLMSAYKEIQALPGLVSASLMSLMQLAIEAPDKAEYYYGVREDFNRARGAGVDQAARMIWLNKSCFNGLYRENQKGQFNVPYSLDSRHTMPTVEEVRAFSKALQGVEISCGSYQTVNPKSFQAGDHVYLDPPYITEADNFTAYSGVGFDNLEHVELARLAVKAANAGARVVISNSNTELTHEIYNESSGFRVHSSPMVARSIGGRGASRARASEVILVIG